MASNESTSGAGRIAAAFERARREGRAALIPYLCLGYPTPETSLALAEAAIAGGADVLELGVPFSDPLADGPVIQHAAHTALQGGGDGRPLPGDGPGFAGAGDRDAPGFHGLL